MSLYPPSTTIPIYAVFTGVGIALTSLRFWIRLSYARAPYPSPRLHLDDIFILVALLIVCTCAGIQFYNALHGASGNAISKQNAVAQALIEYKVDFAMLVIEKPAFGAIKLSLLFFYKRIFGFWPSFRRMNKTLIWIVALWTVAFFLADVLLCGRRPELHWVLDQRPNREKCGNKGVLLICFAATSVITDALVLGLPLLYIRRLRLEWGKKAAACFVFLLGGISTMAGVLRLIFLSVAYPTGRLGWGYQPPPHQSTPLVLRVFNPTFWVMIEMTLGIWAANLPALAPFVRGVEKRYKASSLYRKFSSSGTPGSGYSYKRQGVSRPKSTFQQIPNSVDTTSTELEEWSESTIVRPKR